MRGGSNTEPGFLVWYTFFNYILYNSFRVYSYYITEKKLGEFVSFKKFQDRRTHMLSFKDFLDNLCCRDSFGISQFDKYYPGLKEKCYQFKLFPTKLRQRKERYEQKMEDKDRVDNDESGDTTNARVYRPLEKVIDRSTQQYKKRVDESLRHCHIAIPQFKEKGDRVKLHCVMCCIHCNTKLVPKHNSRHGRTTTKYCFACEVVLRVNRFNIFHEQHKLPLPNCMMSKLGVRNSQSETNETSSDVSRYKLSVKSVVRKR